MTSTFEEAWKLFDELCDLTPAEQAERLAGTPELSAEIRDRVESLLAGDRIEDSRWERPAIQHLGRRDPEDPASGVPGLRPGDRVGEFRLVCLLGRGGMGQVWEAEQPRLGRKVALKLVRHELITTPYLALFSREGRAGARLSSPFLVRTYDHGEDGGIPWIAQELVPGSRTLADLVRELRGLEKLPSDHYRTVAALVSCVARGLAVAHGAGVVHRDIKPRNVLLAPDGTPKVTDFGIARILDEGSLQLTGRHMGFPAYMSPELISGDAKAVDPRSDVFSLGVVLYELLTQRRPFDGDTAEQVLDQIRTSDPRPPRELHSRCPEDLSIVCGKALEKRPEDRYASMEEFAADLDCFLAGKPIRARPPGALRKAYKWCLRHPTRSVAAGLGTVALLGTGAVGLLASARASQVLRLSALRNVEALRTEADELWPVRPERIGAFQDWLRRAEDLCAAHAGFAEARDTLRSRGHMDEGTDSAFTENARALRGEIDFSRFLVSSAEGRPSDPPNFDLGLGTLPADGDFVGKNELALFLVDPDRTIWGGETLGLRLAQEALKAEVPEFQRALIRDTLAWALFANGRFDEALREMDVALQAAAALPEPHRGRVSEVLTPSQRKLRERVDFLRSDLGLAQERWRIADLERQLSIYEGAPANWTFVSSDDDWWHQKLTRLVDQIEALGAPGGLVQRMTSRLELAATVEDRSLAGGTARDRWRSARDLAAARDGPYGGLELRPVLGLLPLGADPESGLLEFAHIPSGEPAVRDRAGRLQLEEETGLVLVLLPGGSFHLGSQHDPRSVNPYPKARIEEAPIQEHRLAPFFLSKFEITQSQWERITGSNPSQFRDVGVGAGTVFRGKRITGRHPLENVSWEEAMLWLSRLELSLPTETQWEYAARAGTNTPWWTGPTSDLLEGRVNLGDQAWLSGGANRGAGEVWDDGYPIHAPVGSFSANAFGLHDVLGNVEEWCRDWLQHYSFPTRGDDAERSLQASSLRVVRGGAFPDTAEQARSGFRRGMPPRQGLQTVGIRPARRLQR